MSISKFSASELPTENIIAASIVFWSYHYWLDQNMHPPKKKKKQEYCLLPRGLKSNKAYITTNEDLSQQQPQRQLLIANNMQAYTYSVYI